MSKTEGGLADPKAARDPANPLLGFARHLMSLSFKGVAACMMA
jgi:hypothetical protein